MWQSHLLILSDQKPQFYDDTVRLRGLHTKELSSRTVLSYRRIEFFPFYSTWKVDIYLHTHFSGIENLFVGTIVHAQALSLIQR